MNPRDLIPSEEQIKALQGVEAQLLQRQRKGKIGFLVAIVGALSQVMLAALGKENFVTSVGQILETSRTFQWRFLVSAPALGFYAIIGGFGAFLIYRYTAFLAKEATEPFRYTFWIDEFKEAGGKAEAGEGETPQPASAKIGAQPGEPAINEEDPKVKSGMVLIPLLHHDLMEKLNDRIRRLSLFDETIPAAATYQARLNSHIQVTGHYVVRENDKGNSVIHVMPRVRVGPPGNPATLAHPVKYEIGKDQGFDVSRYNQVMERVYSSIATEVYRQIEADVKEKIGLFPTRYRRAVAYYYEAEDFASSNTIDAYESAIRLYQQSLRYFNMAVMKGITDFVVSRNVIWRLRIKSKHMEARVQIGYAKCLIFRRQISALTGRSVNPLFEILGTLREVINILDQLHSKMGPFKERKRSGLFMNFLTFPKDSLRRSLSLQPLEPLFERQRRILFEAYVVSALAHSHLDAGGKAIENLKNAKAVDPQFSERNPLYLLALAEIEPDPDKAIRLARQATDMDPDFQIAQYLLAYSSQMRMRTRNELVEARAKSVLEEYDKVLVINPGNIASLAAQGYLHWLLADPTGKDTDTTRHRDAARKKFEEGSEIKAIVGETFIGELNYGLARIAAEESRFDISFDLFTLALESDPGIGAYAVTASRRPVNSYYDYITPCLLERYEKFATRVEGCREALQKSIGKKGKVSKSVLNAVYSFALNDYGNACLNYYIRFGDHERLMKAIQLYEKAVAENSDNVVANYNLAIAYGWSFTTNSEKDALKVLEDITQRVPTWQAAVISFCQRLMRAPRKEMTALLDQRNELTTEIARETDILESARSEITEARSKVAKLEELRLDLYRRYVSSLSPGVRVWNNLGFLPGSSNLPSPDPTPNYSFIENQIREQNRRIQEKEGQIKETSKRISDNLEGNLAHANAQLGALQSQLTNSAEKAISSIMENTKLSSLFEDFKGKYDGSEASKFLADKKIIWQRLDENDVQALRAWAEILSTNEQNRKALNASVAICDLILGQFDPSNFDVNWVLHDALQVVTKQRPNAKLEERKRQAKEAMKPTITRWLDQDPLHFFGLGWYQDYFAEDAYDLAIDRALKAARVLIPTEAHNNYRRTLVQYHEANLRKALKADNLTLAEQYFARICKVGPFDASFFTSLASELENSSAPSGRANAAELALKCLQRAVKIDPANDDNHRRLDRLVARKELAGRFGEKILEKLSDVTPVTIDVSRDLLQHISADGLLQTSTTTLLSELVKGLKETMGVEIPTPKFRDGSAYLTGGEYAFLIEETLVGVGVLPQKELLFFGSAKGLEALGIRGRTATSPRTGEPAMWVMDDAWATLKDAGYKLWAHDEYIIQHLAGVLIGRLQEFVGQQEVMWMLQNAMSDVSESFRMGNELTLLTTVLRRLLDERVPIVALEEIVIRFIQLRKTGKQVLAIVESARMLPAVRPRLPGNGDGHSIYRVGKNFETAINQAILLNNHASPLLAMKPEKYRVVIEALRSKLGSQRNSVLLVERARLRPFVRKVAEQEFPEVPVLSRKELRADLAGNVVGEVELEKPGVAPAP